MYTQNTTNTFKLVLCSGLGVHTMQGMDVNWPGSFRYYQVFVQRYYGVCKPQGAVMQSATDGSATTIHIYTENFVIPPPPRL